MAGSSKEQQSEIGENELDLCSKNRFFLLNEKVKVDDKNQKLENEECYIIDISLE